MNPGGQRFSLELRRISCYNIHNGPRARGASDGLILAGIALTCRSCGNLNDQFERSYEMKKLMCALAMLGLAFVLSSCDQGGTKSPGSKGSSGKTTSQKKTSKVGVGNVADYVTGVTPLTIKKRKENQIKKIQDKYTKKYSDLDKK